MHRCLYVDEIVRLAACELIADGGEGTAVALARCCKSMEDTVLDALWATQSSFLSLLKTLPEGIWSPGGYKVSTPITTSSLPIIDYSI